MGKKQKHDLDKEVLAARAYELKIEIEALTAERKEVTEKLAAGQQAGETHTYGNVRVETRTNRRINLARAHERYGKKATERVPTLNAVKALSLPEVELDALYDVGAPSVYLTYVEG